MQQASLATGGWRRGTGRILPVLCIAVLAICAARAGEPPAAKAEPPGKEDAAKPESKGASLDRIIKQVEKRYQARVVNPDSGELKGQPVYKLRLLSDAGRVWTVVVDAETGKELDPKTGKEL